MRRVKSVSFIAKRQSVFESNMTFRNKSVKFGSYADYDIHHLCPNSIVITLKSPKRITGRQFDIPTDFPVSQNCNNKHVIA